MEGIQVRPGPHPGLSLLDSYRSPGPAAWCLSKWVLVSIFSSHLGSQSKNMWRLLMSGGSFLNP